MPTNCWLNWNSRIKKYSEKSLASGNPLREFAIDAFLLPLFVDPRRREQELGDGAILGSGPFPLVEELSLLRQRKTELEQQLTTLQDSRKQLMVQLESLMKMIKVKLTSDFYWVW